MAFIDFRKPACRGPFEATYLPPLDAKLLPPPGPAGMSWLCPAALLLLDPGPVGRSAPGLAQLCLRLQSSGPNRHPGFSDAPGETGPHSLTCCLAGCLPSPRIPQVGVSAFQSCVPLTAFPLIISPIWLSPASGLVCPNPVLAYDKGRPCFCPPGEGRSGYRSPTSTLGAPSSL